MRGVVRQQALDVRQRINMEISDRQLELLDQLLTTGLYGTSRTEALRILMIHGLEQAVTAGLIQPRPLSADPNQMALELST